MKKLIFLAICLLSAGMAYAQLTVNSSGNVTITKSLTSGPVSISSDKYKCLGLTYSTSQYSGQSLYSLAHHYPGKSTYGLYSQLGDAATNSNNPGVSMGVYSSLQCSDPYVTGHTPGVRYSICGFTPEYGAAIYGTTSPSFVSLSQSYAGYFVGDTHIQGNLTVSGNINGVVLTPTSNLWSPTSTPSSPLSVDRGTLSSKLQGLTANAFYYNLPESASERSIASKDNVKDGQAAANDVIAIEQDDSICIPEEVIITESDLPLNTIGKQVYAKQHYSLSAEQLEEIFPDLVYENEDGSKSINYVEMVPILVQAIGELSAKVATLESKEGIARKVAAKTTDIDGIGENVQVLALGQNKPNPFGTSTGIEVTVPETVQSAFVYVYDLQGKKVQQVDITARGKQAIQLNAADLVDGMYLYSLVADGKVVETRRMIVEK